MQLSLTFLDIFSGIGGFRLGMEMAGHKCVGHCEIDKFAEKSYRAIFDVKEDEWYAEDITKVQPDELPPADIWCFGFPCQDISIAGAQRGLDGQRSGLFYTVINLLKSKKEEDRPSYLFIENVKNLLSVNDGWDFAKVLFALDEAGYDAEWQVINSAWFVPQHRERIFIIGHFRGRSTRKVLPITGSSTKTLKQFIGGNQGQRVYNVNGLARTLASQGGGQGAKTELYFVDLSKGNIKITDKARAIQARYYKGYSNRPGEVSGVLIRQTKDGFHLYRNDTKKSSIQGTHVTYPEGKSHCLGTSHVPMTINKDYRIRRLTPKECWRLQGFPDWAFERATKVNSDTQLYKQAGNAVTVPVIYEIAKRLKL